MCTKKECNRSQASSLNSSNDQKPPCICPTLENNLTRFTHIQNAQPAGSTQSSNPLWQWPREAAQGRTQFFFKFPWMPSWHPEIIYGFCWPESKFSLFHYFQIVFELNTQWMVFHPRTPTAQFHTTERHILCLEFITVMFSCSGTGEEWHWSFPMIISLNTFWEFKTTASHVCFMPTLDDSFKARGSGSQ